MTERLDRIEATIEANAAAIAELRSAQEAERAAIAELRSTVNSLVQIVEIHQHNHEVSQRNFEAIMNEIRGIRTENQRILEHLFGRQEE
ncbi:hypothetical protein [Floridanema evergladense]|uniref:Uncharacterized protein n=1 Tax=Floridaenema evergladense BLCC-F167 TaxID=3153639 RepID=A0ABV4WKH3_9CYAN